MTHTLKMNPSKKMISTVFNMVASLVLGLLLLSSPITTTDALSFTGHPKTLPKIHYYGYTSSSSISTRRNHNNNNNSRSRLMMISTGEDRSERQSLDISKTTYISLIKSPKDAYQAFAEKGKSNAQMHWLKIFHQSVMGGAYVGFGGLLALSVAGNMAGSRLSNPGLVKMTFAALFPVNLLLIVMTGAQLFTGNSATVSAAKWEGMIEWKELWINLASSLMGNIVGCAAFAWTAHYVGCLTGGTATLVTSTAIAKCAGTFFPTMVRGILCNWMVSLAVFMAGASNDLPGKLIGCWFPVSTFVGIGLEHSVANLFILPCAILLGAKLTVKDIIVKNLIPVILGNFIAGSIIVAASYSYQYRNLGAKSREKFAQHLQQYEARKQSEKDAANAKKVLTAAAVSASSSESSTSTSA